MTNPLPRAAACDQYHRVGLPMPGHLIGDHPAEGNAAEIHGASATANGFRHARRIVGQRFVLLRGNPRGTTNCGNASRCGSNSRVSAPSPGNNVSWQPLSYTFSLATIGLCSADPMSCRASTNAATVTGHIPAIRTARHTAERLIRSRSALYPSPEPQQGLRTAAARLMWSLEVCHGRDGGSVDYLDFV